MTTERAVDLTTRVVRDRDGFYHPAPTDWLAIVPADLGATMRSCGVTIRELAAEAGLTLKAVRRLRGLSEMTRNDRTAMVDFCRAIRARKGA